MNISTGLKVIDSPLAIFWIGGYQSLQPSDFQEIKITSGNQSPHASISSL